MMERGLSESSTFSLLNVNSIHIYIVTVVHVTFQTYLGIYKEKKNKHFPGSWEFEGFRGRTMITINFYNLATLSSIKIILVPEYKFSFVHAWPICVRLEQTQCPVSRAIYQRPV